MKPISLTNNKFDFIDILNLEVSKEPNKHGKLNITAHINEENARIAQNINPLVPLMFYINGTNGEREAFFCGIIEKSYISSNADMYKIDMHCISTTKNSDIENHIRTFQDSTLTYRNIADIVQKESGNLNIIIPRISSNSIDKMLVQYKETDWDFMLRVASRMETVVIPNFTSIESEFALGITHSLGSKEIDIISISSQKNAQEFNDLKAKNCKSLSSSFMNSKIIKSREILSLCDAIAVDNETLLVYSATYQYEGSELVGYYTMKNQSDFCNAEFFNTSIIGSSLLGTVEDIQQDMVKINIYNYIDQREYKWFKYATPFSVPNGPGWYFMPEVGDEIRLRFPDEVEETAYISSSAHITHGTRQNSETKFIRTIYNQEIVFAPNSLHIDDGNGSRMTFNHAEGIFIETDKKFSLKAEKDISIKSDGKININSNKAIKIEKSDSIINVSGNIDIISQHTRIE